MERKNPKTLVVFIILYICAAIYLVYQFSLALKEFMHNSSDLYKILTGYFILPIASALYIYCCISIFMFFYKHFDDAIEFIKKALPYLFYIILVTWILYHFMFQAE